MKKTIYHGSEKIIEQPIYGYGNKQNDYGLGFYCTESIELAKEWAASEFKDGYANEYQIEFDGLKVLYLNSSDYCILHWLAILVENRRFEIIGDLAEDAIEFLKNNYSLDYRHYDVIIGYRADDSYFTFARDFLNGAISYQRLRQAMYLGELGEQVVLISKKAFDRLIFVKASFAPKDIYYLKRNSRDLNARKSYFNSRKSPREKGQLYINQIIDEEIKPDDKRLR